MGRSAAPQGAAATPDPVALSARARVALVWSCIGLLLATAVVAGAGSLSRELYSAEAFVGRYLDALADGDAAAALALPGARPAEAPNVSTALLRGDVLPDYRDVAAHDTGVDAEGRHLVIASATVDGVPVSGTLLVERAGTRLGVLPEWRFAASPTAPVELRIEHTPGFSLNGRELDVRQLGVERAFSHSFDVVLFAPGRYTVERDDPYVAAAPESLTVGDPGRATSLTLDANATPAFTQLVSDAVHRKLDECAAEHALYPQGCPFGYDVEDRIEGEPEWHIRSYPTVRLVPGAEGWALEPTTFEAEITLTVRSLFDGSVSTSTERVSSGIGGDISLDGDRATVTLRAE
ncbi:hypothetical protein D9V30_09685 [Mycetocola reblochoni]|uniref:Uncharacterized protein n=3 Tax=Mycetocola reblochoni TaxID=331618 RepID=A0A1R4KC67_9MICO|nr:hypothetical protein D9V30_09685 [Mycetocola reblochoni]SJN41906.1 hypothetical protein FM119_12950 [Mycetocola reblochoni REB411]